MVQLVQTGSGSLGLKSNEWLNYRERHAEERSREIRARTRPACSWLQNLILWLVCLVFVSWNETFAGVWSTALAKLQFGTEAALMTSDFWFSRSSFLWQHQTVFIFCSAYSGGKRALDTVIMYTCTPNTPGMHKRSLLWNLCVALTDVPCSLADECWACGWLTPAWWSISLF